MKNYIIILLFIFGIPTMAQVGIGTTKPQSQLDISASDIENPKNTDGLLLPRISEFPKIEPSKEQDGMLVFINGKGSETKGFYFWDGTKKNWSLLNPESSITKYQKSSVDADWFKVNTGSAPSLIDDDMYTFGNATIGGNGQGSNARLNVMQFDNEDGIVTGVYSDLQNQGISGSYGHKLANLSVGAYANYGTYNEMNGQPTFVQYGSYQYMNAIGNRRQYGSYNKIISNGSFEQFGSYQEMTGTGSGDQYASYNELTSNSQGKKVAIFNDLKGFTTQEVYGLWNDILVGGGLTQYGVRTNISGGGIGQKYGCFNHIQSSAGGWHVGVYSDVQKPNSFAGIFLGNVNVNKGRLTLTHNIDANLSQGSGLLELGNNLRLDANELITNANSTLYLQHDNNGDLRVDSTTLMVDASTNRVGIGKINPAHKLDVAGDINTSGNIRKSGGAYNYPDYVFENYFDGNSEYNPSYTLQTLDQIEDFLKANKHLPGIQNRADVVKEGWNVSEGVRDNLEKVEELYLYVIQLNKENKKLTKENEDIKSRLERLEKAIFKE